VQGNEQEVTIGLGSDHKFYLLSSGAGVVLFINTADSWREALAQAQSLTTHIEEK